MSLLERAAVLAAVAALFLFVPQTPIADAAAVELTASVAETEKSNEAEAKRDAERSKRKQAAGRRKKEAVDRAETEKSPSDAKQEVATEAGEEKKPAAEGDAEKTEGEEKKEGKPKGLELEGVFEARKMTEITVRPESWSSLKVVSAVGHGQPVRRGQLLLSLDLKPIDEAIADLRTQNRLTDLTIRQAEIGLKELEAKTPLSQTAADRVRRIAKEDFNTYTKVERPMVVKSTEVSLKSSRQRLEYQEEELRQLEEMYKADDLTEETEEIVLKRAQNSVDLARFMYEIAKVNYDLAVKFGLPRRDEQVKEAVAQAEISWQSARSTLPLTLKKTQLDLEKTKVDRQKSAEKLDKLLADRAAMVVRAPVDGVVYFGQCDEGRWSSAATVAKKLRLGGTITPNEVVMTIVQTRPMFVHTTLAEKDLAKVRAGDPCRVVPTSDPDLELKAIVGEVGTVPVDSKKFDMRVTLSGKIPASLVPGMTCQVKFAAPEQTQDKPDKAEKEADEGAKTAEQTE